MAEVLDFSRWRGYGFTGDRIREKMIQQLKEEGISNQKLLQIMKETPRHCFIDSALSHQAYEGVSLPICSGQTISQPFIVAYMTQYILEKPILLENVLEIGTGCGYQTTILSQFFKNVFTIERVENLFNFSKDIFNTFNIQNITQYYGDGYSGWLDKNITFDAVIFTAATKDISKDILKQVKDIGVLIAPLEGIEGTQYLVGINKNKQQSFSKEILMPVKFVKMKRGCI